MSPYCSRPDQTARRRRACGGCWRSPGRSANLTGSSGDGGTGSEGMDMRQLPRAVLGQPLCLSLWAPPSTMMTSLQGNKAPCASMPAWITFFDCNGRPLSDLATHWDGSQNSSAGEMASDSERGPHAITQHREEKVGGRCIAHCLEWEGRGGERTGCALTGLAPV